MIITTALGWARKISQATSTGDIENARRAFSMAGAVAEDIQEILELLCQWVHYGRLVARIENGQGPPAEDMSAYFGLVHYANRITTAERQQDVDAIREQYQGSKLLTRAEKAALDIMLPWVAYGRDCYATKRIVEADKERERLVNEMKTRMRNG